MTRFGYTLMTEQGGPKQLVDYAVSAERLGFDFAVCNDHYSSWLSAQGHAANAWTVLRAVAHATDRVELCGPDLDAVVDAVSEYWQAGFTDIALVQTGDDGQDRFLKEAAQPLLEKLRAAACRVTS